MSLGFITFSVSTNSLLSSCHFNGKLRETKNYECEGDKPPASLMSVWREEKLLCFASSCLVSPKTFSFLRKELLLRKIQDTQWKRQPLMSTSWGWFMIASETHLRTTVADSRRQSTNNCYFEDRKELLVGLTFRIPCFESESKSLKLDIVYEVDSSLMFSLSRKAFSWTVMETQPQKRK